LDERVFNSEKWLFELQSSGSKVPVKFRVVLKITAKHGVTKCDDDSPATI